MFNPTGAGRDKFPMNNRESSTAMAAIFAVFLIALLAVFLRPEGRAGRIARASDLARRGVQVGRNLFARGSETVDRLSADLAPKEGQPGGLDDLLGPPQTAPVAPTAELARAAPLTSAPAGLGPVSTAQPMLMFETRRAGMNGS